MKDRMRMVLPVLACASLALLALPACGQSRPRPDASRAWPLHVRSVDQALARRDVSAAVWAWHDAYVAAQASRNWEALVEVADAHLRIGEAAGLRKRSEPKARELYLAAFFRAREARALEGIVRATEAFAALGDRDVAEQCLRTAANLARGAPPGSEAHRRVETSRERVASLLAKARGAAADPMVLRFPGP